MSSIDVTDPSKGGHLGGNATTTTREVQTALVSGKSIAIDFERQGPLMPAHPTAAPYVLQKSLAQDQALNNKHYLKL